MSSDRALIRTMTILLSALALTGGAAAQTVLYVDDDAPPGGDGLAWGTAYRFLQDALTVASTLGNSMEVRVAGGVYLPDLGDTSDCCTQHDYPGCGNPECEAIACEAWPPCCEDAWGSLCVLAAQLCGELCNPPTGAQVSFELINGVTLLGGFAGLGATDPDNRDIALFETVLSGDLAGNDEPRDFPWGPTFDENSLHVVTGSGTDGTAVLDGVTITAGIARGPIADRAGGGMLIGGATIVRCTFAANAATYGGGLSGSPTLIECLFVGNSAINGGGLSGSPTLIECLFVGNTADVSGGAISGSPTAIDCVFEGNTALFSGGAVRHGSFGVLTITGGVFTDNEALLGGGLYNSDGVATIAGATFNGNVASLGGAVYDRFGEAALDQCSFSVNEAVFGGGLYVDASSPAIEACVFDDNVATLDGGGVYSRDGDPTLTECTFAGNVADRGGGMYSDGGSPAFTGCTFHANSVGSLGGGMFNSFSTSGVTNCTFTENSAGSGGGMGNDGGSPTVTNCTFSENSAGVGGSGDGGGMHNFESSPTVTDCTFSENGADNGGGMYNENNSSPTVTDSTFSGNSGGGMHNFESSPSVIDCTFSENGADNGGGMYNENNSSPTVTKCVFRQNGALLGSGMANVEASSPLVLGCEFTDNHGWSFCGSCCCIGSNGGGMANIASSPIVIASFFEGNTVRNNTSGGSGGAMVSDFGSDPTVLNSVFFNNAAIAGCHLGSTSWGGAMQFSGSARVINCVLAGNDACQGGGISGGDSMTVLNCVLWGNTGNTPQIAGAVAVSFSDVQGGWTGAGNIDADPLFVDPDNGDFRLSPGSPCRDAGHNNAIADLTDTDLDGNPRFAGDPGSATTGCGVPVVVDMGAYEFQGEPATVVFGDINGNGRVDIMDLLDLNGCMGSDDPACCVADLDLDGEVGMSDLMLLVARLVHHAPSAP